MSDAADVMTAALATMNNAMKRHQTALSTLSACSAAVKASCGKGGLVGLTDVHETMAEVVDALDRIVGTLATAEADVRAAVGRGEISESAAATAIGALATLGAVVSDSATMARAARRRFHTAITVMLDITAVTALRASVHSGLGARAH